MALTDDLNLDSGLLTESPKPRRIRPTTPHLDVLTEFAKENNLQVGSTTGGRHNAGSLHYSGNAIDIKGSGAFDDSRVNALKQQAAERGLLLRDERRHPPGQKVWGGPHVHLEYRGQDDPQNLSAGLPKDDLNLDSGIVSDQPAQRTVTPSVTDALDKLTADVNRRVGRIKPTSQPSVALARLQAKYPWTRGTDVNIIDSTSKGDPSRKLEFYPADETDNPQRGKPTIEIFDKNMKDSDLMGEILSHHLPLVDRNVAGFRRQILNSMTPQQKDSIRGDYENEKQQGLTSDPFEAWLQKQGGDSFFRGYPTGQWDAKEYTSQQKQIYQQLQRYLDSKVTPQPVIPPITSALDTLTRDVNRRVGRIKPQSPFAGVRAGVSGISGQPAQGVGDLRRIDDQEVSRIQRIQKQVDSERQASRATAYSVPGIMPTRPYMGQVDTNDEVLNRVAAERRQEAEAAKHAEWQKKNAQAIADQTAEYRRDIQKAKARGGDANKWLAEMGSKGAAGLTELVGGIVKPVAPELSNKLRVHVEAAHNAAVEEGADRNWASKMAQDVVGGFISSAPELAAMSAGIPAPAVFGAGSGLRAYGGDRPIAPAVAQGAATGAAFEIPVEGALAKAGTVGATTTGIDLASGQSPQEALKSGAVNAIMAGLGGRKGERETQRQGAAESIQREGGRLESDPRGVFADRRTEAEAAPGEASVGNQPASSVEQSQQRFRRQGEINARQAETQRQGVPTLEPVAEGQREAAPMAERLVASESSVSEAARPTPSGEVVDASVHHSQLQPRRARNTEHGNRGQFKPGKVPIEAVPPVTPAESPEIQSEAVSPARQAVSPSQKLSEAPEILGEAGKELSIPPAESERQSVDWERAKMDYGRGYNEVNYRAETWPIGKIKQTEFPSESDVQPKLDILKRQIQSGIVRPILVSAETGGVLNGNNRLKAYQQLGIKDVPVLVVTGEGTGKIEFPKRSLEDDVYEAFKDRGWIIPQSEADVAKVENERLSDFEERRLQRRPIEQPSTPSVAEGSPLPEGGKSLVPEPELRKETSNVETPLAKPSQPEQSSKGTGGRTPEKEIPPAPKPSTTSARKSQFATDREALDLPELPPAERKKWQVTLNEAKEKGTQNAGILADEVLSKPRALNDTETAQLVLRAQEIKNEHSRVMREIGDSSDTAEIQAKRAQAVVLENEFDRLTRATKASGTEKGRALASQKLTINQDYDLVSMVQRAKAARGRELRPEERQKIESQAKEIESLTRKLADAEERVKTASLQQSIDKISRQRRRAETKATLDDEFADLKAQFAQAKAEIPRVQASGLASLDPEGKLTILIGKMARNRVKAGTVRAEALVDEIYSAVKEHLPDLTKRDIRDAISGYSIAPKSTRSELQKQLDAIRSELQSLSKTEDIETGIRSPRREGPRRSEVRGLPAEGPRKSEARSSGVPLEGPKLGDVRKVPAQGPRLSEAARSGQPLQGPRMSEARRLPAEGPKPSEIRKVRKEEGPRMVQHGPPRQLFSRDVARRNALLKQEAELVRRMSVGDYSEPPKREPPKYTRETYQIQKRLNEVKQEYERDKYRATRSVSGKIADTVAGVGNVPKTLLSMGDVSALFRQGGYGFVTHPILSSKAAVDMVKSFSARGFANVEHEIKNHPKFDEAKRNGLEFTGVDKDDPHLSKREEGYLGADFINTLARGRVNPLRIVKGIKDVSERTFVSFLDSQRMRLYDAQSDAIQAMKLSPEQTSAALKAQAKLINIATGRGSLGRQGNQAAPLLNVGMFSPRLLASRVQILNKMFNPVAWARQPTGSRSLMMKDNAKFLAFTAITLGLAKAAGLNVNTDYDDADFLKIKVGDTRYDHLTGLQQPMRFFLRMASAVKGGETYAGDTKSDILMDFGRSKASPAFGYGWDFLEGRNRLSGKQFEAGKDLARTLVPLPMQDFAEAVKNDGVLRGMVEAMPSLTGVGVQTYKGAAEKPATQAEKLARRMIIRRMPDEARTQAEIDKSQAMSELRARSRRGEDVANKVTLLPPKQAAVITNARGQTRLQEDFKRLSANPNNNEALTVYKVMTRSERDSVKEMFAEKVDRVMQNLSEDEQAELKRQLAPLGLTEVEGRKPREPRQPRTRGERKHTYYQFQGAP